MNIMKILAIVIARIGSKGIPQKNLQKLAKIPLVEHSINCAKNSKLVNRIIVSTDSKKLAKISKNAGAEIPFLRPKKFARDSSSQLDVIKHALDFLEKNDSYIPDIVTILHPTNPFRSPELLDSSIKLLKKSNADLVIEVAEVTTHPYRSFWYKSNFLKQFSPNFHKFYQRQLFPPLYFPTGNIYTFWYKSYKRNGVIFGPKIKPIFAKKNEISINIDTPYDLFVAEMTLKNWKKYKKKFGQ